VPSTTPVLATSPSGPVPVGFTPDSFTAIGELTWWLLGTAPCSSAPCTSIVRTDDGGRTFVGIPAPGTDQVSELRFADAENGFAYGPELWVTHDAGATWNQVSVPGSVRELAIGSGYAYAIVRSGSTGELLRAATWSDSWTELPVAGDAYGGLWVNGKDVMLESSTTSGSAMQLLVSPDDGATFSARALPPSIACNFDGALPAIWADCATGTLSGVWRSQDSGATWVAAGGDATRSGVPGEPNSAAFAAASPVVAVYGYQQLFRTADGGATWSQVPTPAGITWWQYLGFTDATHGVALGYAGTEKPANERLYYTTDAGATYHPVTIAGS